MQLRDLFTDWLSALRYEQNVTPASLTTYRPRLRAFLDWLEADMEKTSPLTPDVLTPATCRRYVYHLAQRGNRPRTVRGHFDAIRSFCRFLVDMGVLTENPTIHLTLPKLDAALRREVTDEEVSALFVACDRLPSVYQGTLARAVLSVLCYGGLRRDELCSLFLDDVNLTEKSVYVRSGKGRKSRRVYLCKEGIDALRQWLAVRKETPDNPHLFIVDKRRRIHYKGLAALLVQLKAVAGLRAEVDLTPHCLRHWSATNLLRNGANLRDVQTHLGHSNAIITAKYLHADEKRLQSLSELTGLRSASQEEPEQGKVLRLPQDEQGRSRLRRRAI